MRAAALALALAGLPAVAAAADCLKYGPHEVTLEGRLEARVGQSLVRGEPGKTETVDYYALVLDSPVCIAGAGRGLVRPEVGLSTFQLTLGGLDAVDRALVGQRVRATGQLHHRRASRQYTPVLIHVSGVAPT